MAQILAMGYPGDRTLRHIVAATAAGEVAFLNLDDYYDDGDIAFSTANPAAAIISTGRHRFSPGDFSGICQRVYEPHSVPVGPRKWREIISRHLALKLLLSSLDLPVVNRSIAGWQNASKLMQTWQLMEAGFDVPASLSTSLADDYTRFRSGGRTIYKSNSWVRSIVDDVDGVEAERLSFLHTCPVLFQRRIAGTDARVHVVGRSVFPIAIESDAVDYRYYSRQGSYAQMTPCDIPAAIADRCVAFAAEQGVEVAGFDFKVDPAGTWYCLEMNPWPGFEGYDDVLGGKIAEAVLDVLRGSGGRRDGAIATGGAVS